MFLGALIHEGFCEVKFAHSIRLRFSAHFFGLWTAHWWWRSSHAAGGDPVGFETRSHMSAIPPIRLLRGMQMIWRTGNCGTANFSDLGCRRLLLDFHLKNHIYIYTYICVYTQNHIDSYSILQSNNIKTKETNIQRSTIKQVRYQSCFLVYEFCGSKGLEKSSAMIGPVLSLVWPG